MPKKCGIQNSYDSFNDFWNKCIDVLEDVEE